MQDLLAESHLVSTLLFGALTGTLGLLGLLLHSGKKPPSWRPALALALVLAALGAGAALAGLEASLWQPFVSAGGVCLVLAFLRSPAALSLGKGLFGLLRHPAAQSGILLLIGLGTVVAQSYAITQQRDQDIAESDVFIRPQDRVPDLSVSPVVTGYTDEGSAVPVWVPNSDASMAHEPGREARFLQGSRLELKVIQTAPASNAYNCHGWIFAGGRFWVRGANVAQILKENGYRPAGEPRPGDVAVFRDATGEVSHSALVRSAGPGGAVILESKWGQMGRYLHRATEHAYSSHHCTYYRSSREGHVLRGLEAEAVERADLK